MTFQPFNILYEKYKECTRCPFCETRENIVWGEGHPNARIVFVGEGPGKGENKIGRPFIGKSGQVLTRLIAAFTTSPEIRKMVNKGYMHEAIRNTLYEHEGIYITNSVLCGDGEQKPKKKHLRACRERLMYELYTIDPICVIALGGPAASILLDRDVKITQEHGRFVPFEIKKEYFKQKDYPIIQDSITKTLLITYHPAYLLRNIDTHLKDKSASVWFQMAEDIYSAFYWTDQVEFTQWNSMIAPERKEK